VRINFRERRRTVISVAGSVAAHLLVLGALVWVKPPSMVVDVKRGEPLFVELPAADEQAQRGLPPASTPERPKAQPAPRPVAPVASPAPVTPPPPMVARTEPEPAPVTPPPPPVEPAPAPPPPVAQAPAPAEPAKKAPPEAAGPRVAPLAPVPPTPREAVPDIRAALRRGGPGPGGAGGSGEGRAGIEGEPIPLDSKDPRYNDYLDRVRRMIKEKWAYPCVKNDATGHCEYKSAQLVIEFGILKDGRVPFVVVRKHSDFDIYDEYALNAIKLASPFPPVPDALTSGRKGIPILATFSYIVESSLTNLLR
jgi:outer membrane biosynthesis protein TonB